MKGFVRINERALVEHLNRLQARFRGDILIGTIRIDQWRENGTLMASDPLPMLNMFSKFQELSKRRANDNRPSVESRRITWAYCSWICFCSAETNERSRFSFFTNSMSSSLEDMIHLSKRKRIRKPLIVSFLCIIIIIRFTDKKKKLKKNKSKKKRKQISKGQKRRENSKEE